MLACPCPALVPVQIRDRGVTLGVSVGSGVLGERDSEGG